MDLGDVTMAAFASVAVNAGGPGGARLTGTATQVPFDFGATTLGGSTLALLLSLPEAFEFAPAFDGEFATVLLLPSLPVEVAETLQLYWRPMVVL
jgi:hypothetical protein